MPNNPWAAAEKLNPVAGESQYKTLLRLAAERRRREEEERKRLEAEAEAKAAAGQEDDWEAEAEEIRRQNLAKMAEREEMERARATREVARQAIPLNVTPGDLPAAGLPEYNLNASEAAEVLAAMPVQERFDAAARIGGGLANSLSLLKKSGLPGAEEVESYARQTGISRNLVRDLLPHAKDELEARAMAKRLLDIYGDDPAAVDNSYLMNQVRLKPDSAYWLQPDMEAKARFEAALMSQRGGFLAGLTDNPTWKAIGKFADQQASRLWQGYKEIGRQNVKIVHGISSAAAGLAGAQSVKKWLDDIHREIQHLNPQTRIDTGNQAVDWLLDKAFIDAPNLYSQMAPYVILGKTYGWAARVAGMWGGELSDMLEADVPLAYALPWSAISAGLQSYIESAKIYPRFESLARGIANNPALQRPLAQWAIEGGIESLKQVPDEFLQNSVSKLMGDLGQLSASGDTEEFYRRLLSGWGEPIEGAATAGIASLFLMGAGAPAAARAHLRYRAKIAGVEQALTAAAADKQLAADPIRYKENIQPIIKNALTYNQATPAEVYIPAAKVDELAADPAERDRLLDIMGAREEYRRSKATGAVMAIKLEGYVAAIANHAKRGEWQKWIQVDLDGPDSQQAEKAEETQKRIQAEADELVRQIRGLAGGGEALPPELEVLRGDLRQIKKLSADEVDHIAAMHYAAAKVAAADLGGTPGDWIKRQNVRIKFADAIKNQADIDALVDRIAPGQADPETPAAADPGPPPPPAEAPGPRPSAPPPRPAMPAAAPEGPRYQPSPAESAAANAEADRLEALRRELGAALLHGRHMESGELQKYGLTAWHPQTVRMRMGELAGEAKRWREFEKSPRRVAELRDRLGIKSRETTFDATPPIGDMPRALADADKVGALVDAALENPAGEQKPISIGGEAGGPPHSLSVGVVLNAVGQGTAGGREQITREDLLAVPLALAAADSVTPGAAPGSVRYVKTVGDAEITVEEKAGENGREITRIDKRRLRPTETPPVHDDAADPNRQNQAALPVATRGEAAAGEWRAAALDSVADASGAEGERRQAVREAAARQLDAGEDVSEGRALAEAAGPAAPVPLPPAAEGQAIKPEPPGRRTKIAFPPEAKKPPIPARYKIVELDSLQPSHTFGSYTENPAWSAGELAQQRNYASGSMQATREGIAIDRLDMNAVLSPTTDAINGPPIVSPEGKVYGGNNRTHRIHSRYDADGYRAKLLEHLASDDNLTGLSAERAAGMEKPVLVREVEVAAGEAPALIGDLNADFTTRRDPGNLAANRGLRVGRKTLLAFSGMNGKTFSQFLDDPANAGRVLQSMLEDGALQTTDLPEIYDFANEKWLGSGKASGKNIVEQALFGAVLPDGQLLDEMTPGIKAKLLRALPSLLRMKREGSPELETLIQAMRWQNEFQDFKKSALGQQHKSAAGQIEAFRAPNMADMFTGQTAGAKGGPAWQMFLDIQKAKSQKEVAEYFAGMAEKLSGQNRLFQAGFHGSPHRFDRFSTDAIGSGEGAQIHGWGIYALRGDGYGRMEHADARYRERLIDDDEDTPIRVAGTFNGAVRYANTNEGWMYELENGDSGQVSDKYELLALKFFKEGIDWAKGQPGADSEAAKIEAIGNLKEILEEGPDEDGDFDIKGIDVYVKEADIREAIDFLKEHKFEKENPGQLYRVEIPDNDVLLHEDLPLPEQPEKVREAIRKLVESRPRLNKKTIGYTVNGIRYIINDDGEYEAEGAGSKIDDFEASRILSSIEYHGLNKHLSELKREIRIDQDMLKRGVNLYGEPLSKSSIEGIESRVAHQQKEISFIENNTIEAIEEPAGIITEQSTGGEIYNAIANVLEEYGESRNGNRDASLLLNQFGIKGIAYEGETDGPAAVVFDDAAIQILETYYQFAGERSNMGRPIQRNLTAALGMETEGRDAGEIREQTGWFKGMDGRWRYEIPDNLDKISLPQAAGEFVLGDIYDNPALYRAYPELQAMRVVVAESLDGFSGSYNETARQINLSRANSESEQKKTLLHEIQHAIQTAEGFAAGGSPEGIYESAEYQAKIQAYETELKDFARDNPEYAPFVAEVRGLDKRTYKAWAERAKAKGDNRAVKRIDDRLTDLEWRRRAAIEKMEAAHPAKKDAAGKLYRDLIALETGVPANELYFRLAGEVEARDVERRADLTGRERKRTAPDLPAEAIVTFAGRTMASVGLDQGENAGLFGQDAKREIRGSVTFEDGLTLIQLLRGKADFSTVLHELGHVYLRDLENRVADGQAGEASIRTLEALRKLAGGRFDREGVERVARHWEAWLREGKAPSVELTDAFDAFSARLNATYEEIGPYLGGELNGGELNDETREAFGRLLASEQEMAEVREYYYDTRERLEGLDIYTPSEKKTIADKRRAVELDEQARRNKIKLEGWLKAMEQQAPARRQAEADVEGSEAYQALNEIGQEGGIDEAEARELVGDAMVDAIIKQHGRDVFGGRPETLQAIADARGYGNGQEILEELARAPEKAEAIRARLREIMGERADKASQWLKEIEALPGDADYHGGQRLELMAMQLEGLRRLLNETTQKGIQRLNLKAVTDAAAATVDKMLVRDVARQRQFALAERKAGQETASLAANGDIQGAYEALERQMYAHAITREMFIQAERRAVVRRGTTAKKMLSALENILEPYREPMRQLLTGYGFAQRPQAVEGPDGTSQVVWKTPLKLRPTTPVKRLLLPEHLRDATEFEGGEDNLRDFLPDLREHIPEWVQRLEKPRDLENWRDLTVKQLREITDAMELLQTVGRGELSALRSERYQTVEQAVKGIVERINQAPERPAEYDADDATGKAWNFLENFLLKGVTVESIAAVAEGNKSLADKGELQSYPGKMRKLEATENLRHREIFARLEPHLKSLGQEAGRLDGTLRATGGQVEGLPFHDSLAKARGKKGFTGEMLLAAALNSGNADNLHQLREAYDWNEENIAALRRQISDAGWRAIEAIWAEMDALYPDMAQVAFDATHQRPPKEPGLPFAAITADGKVHQSRGGYYPLIYDGLITARQGAFQDLSNARAMAGAGMTFTANRAASGFSKARARGDEGELVFKGAPILKLAPMAKHFDQTLHFITHGQAIWELDRITADKRFREAFVERNGQAKYRAIRQWVNYLANPTGLAWRGKTGPMFNFLHDRFITSILGLNIFSAQKQRLGYFAALPAMSDAAAAAGDKHGTATALKYLGQAMWDFGIKGNIGLVGERWKTVTEMSPVMRSRDEGGPTKELADRVKLIAPRGGDLRLFGKKISLANVRDNLFKLITIADRATAGPIWLASYRMFMDGKAASAETLAGLDDAGRRQAAIAYADSVAMTQASPYRTDYSPLQRGDDVVAKFASVCISGVMQPGNMLYQKIARAWRGQATPGEVASFIGKAYVAMSLSEILAGGVYGTLTGEEEPWPEWYDWFLRPLENMVNWIPYVREIPSALRYRNTDKGLPQVSKAFEQVGRLKSAVGKAEKGKATEAAWSAAQVFAYFAGIPLPAAARVYRDAARLFGWDGGKRGRAKKEEERPEVPPAPAPAATLEPPAEAASEAAPIEAAAKKKRPAKRPAKPRKKKADKAGKPEARKGDQ